MATPRPEGARNGHSLVRPYVMTGGRTRAGRRDLRVETMLSTVANAQTRGLSREQAELVELCRTPMALAEAASHLGLVIGVVSVLAGDLVSDGIIEISQTNPVEVELDTLYRLIDAVRDDS